MKCEVTYQEIVIESVYADELNALIRAFSLDSGFMPTASTPTNVKTVPNYKDQSVVVRITHRNYTEEFAKEMYAQP